MISKKLESSHLEIAIVNLIADAFEIMGKCSRKIIVKYRRLLPCGKQVLIINP